jgi:phosphatidylserine synthase
MRRLLGEAKLRALSLRRRETPWWHFPPLSLAEEAGVVDALVVTTDPKKEEPFDNLPADVAAMIVSILLHVLAHSVFLGSRRETNLYFTTRTPQGSMGHYFFTSSLSPYPSYNNTHVQERLQLLLFGIFAAFFFVFCVLTRHPKGLLVTYYPTRMHIR